MKYSAQDCWLFNVSVGDGQTVYSSDKGNIFSFSVLLSKTICTGLSAVWVHPRWAWWMGIGVKHPVDSCEERSNPRRQLWHALPCASCCKIWGGHPVNWLFLSSLSSINMFFLQLPRFHYSQIRVKFEGEDGSGPGVNRGYFAAFANALKNNEIVSCSSVCCCYFPRSSCSLAFAFLAVSIVMFVLFIVVN